MSGGRRRHLGRLLPLAALLCSCAGATTGTGGTCPRESSPAEAAAPWMSRRAAVHLLARTCIEAQGALDRLVERRRCISCDAVSRQEAAEMLLVYESVGEQVNRALSLIAAIGLTAEVDQLGEEAILLWRDIGGAKLAVARAPDDEAAIEEAATARESTENAWALLFDIFQTAAQAVLAGGEAPGARELACLADRLRAFSAWSDHHNHIRELGRDMAQDEGEESGRHLDDLDAQATLAHRAAEILSVFELPFDGIAEEIATHAPPPSNLGLVTWNAAVSATSRALETCQP